MHPLLEKLKGTHARTRAVPAFRMVVWAVVLFNLAVIGAFTTWMTLRPIDSYRPLLAAQIKTAMQAEEVKLGHLSWKFYPLRLGLGVEVESVNIEHAPHLAKLEIPRVVFQVQPLKLLFGKLPLKVIASGGTIVVADAPAGKAADAAAPVSEAEKKQREKWMSYLRTEVELKGFDVVVDPALLGSPGEESTAHFKDVVTSFVLTGFPGDFVWKAETDVDLDLGRGKNVAHGPLEAEARGFFEIIDGKPAAIRFELMKIDADHALFSLAGGLEKTADSPFSFQSRGRLRLNDQGAVRAASIDEGKVNLSGVEVDVSGEWKGADGTDLRWSLARRDVKEWKLPVKGLRRVPLSGTVETAGSLDFRSGKLESAIWRIGLSQMSIETSELKDLLEAGSKGKVKVSFVSEGSLRDGQLSSPRTELQLEGAEARIEVADGLFVKPEGHRLEALFKAKIQDNRMDLDQFEVKLHQMEIHGRGGIEGVSKLLKSESARLKLDLISNRVDLSSWTGYTAALRKPPPIEGFAEFSGALDWEVGGDPAKTQPLSWRVDRMNVSNVRGKFDEEANAQLGIATNNWTLNGPFTMSFLFQGHGRGTVVDRGTLISQADFSQLAMNYRDEFRKPAGVPLRLDVSAQQSRNQLAISRGSLRFHELDLSFDGRLIQGSRNSFINLSMAKPVHLGEWKQFFIKSPKIPLEGTVQWKGRIGMGTASKLEADLDLARLVVEGELTAQGLGGRVASLVNPIRNGVGKLLLQKDGITVPIFRFELGEMKGALSGNVAPRGAKGADKGSLGAYLKATGWEGRIQLALSKFAAQDFATTTKKALPLPENMTTPPGPTTGEQLRAVLEMPLVRNSSFQLSLQVGEAKFGEIEVRQLNARTLWRDGNFNLQPFGATVFGAKLSGSLLLDANPFYGRKDAPQIQGSLKAEGMDLAKAATFYRKEYAKLVGGQFTGNLTFSSAGWEIEDWLKAGRGRLEGAVKNGDFDTIWAFQRSLESFALGSQAKDYLMKEFRKESCLQKNFDAQVDLSLDHGRVGLEKSEIRFATGSSLLLTGAIESNLALAMNGRFLASASCVGGDARACLAGPDGRAVVPFQVAGLLTKPEPEIDAKGLAQKVVACIAGKVKQRAEEEAKKQIEKGLDQVGEKAKNAIQDLFKGGK